MTIIKLFIKLTIKVIFFISFFNSVNAKNFDNFERADKISNYLSGIISFDNNEYANSFKYLDKLNNLEKKHPSYSKVYQFSLVNLERIEDAFNYGKKLEKQKIYNFENNLIMGVYHLKKNEFVEAQKFFSRLNDIETYSNMTAIISLSLNNLVRLHNKNENEDFELINKIPERFENIKKIQKAFVGCFYNSINTEKIFLNLLNDPNIDFSRYNFFYANYYLNNNNIPKAKKIIDKAIKSYPNNLILNQFNYDLKKKSFFANKFDCKNISHIIAEIFYITSNALSQNSLYSLSNFYLNLAKYLNPNFISFETLYAENFFKIKNYKNSKKFIIILRKKVNFIIGIQQNKLPEY